MLCCGVILSEIRDMKVKIVCDTYCPGASGNKTTTTYRVVPSTQVGYALWEGESEFIGELFEQVYTSSKWSGLDFKDPKINSRAPLGLVNIAKELASKNWRCKV